jgi:hypothetical protein
MKEERQLGSPELTEELLQDRDLDLVKEYVEYLRAKVKRRDDGAYCCVTKLDGPYKCWDQTEQFCREKGLDSDTFVYEFALKFGCESNVANSFDLDAFNKGIKEKRKDG